jgi:hypothetical protein
MDEAVGTWYFNGGYPGTNHLDRPDYSIWFSVKDGLGLADPWFIDSMGVGKCLLLSKYFIGASVKQQISVNLEVPILGVDTQRLGDFDHSYSLLPRLLFEPFTYGIKRTSNLRIEGMRCLINVSWLLIVGYDAQLDETSIDRKSGT